MGGGKERILLAGAAISISSCLNARSSHAVISRQCLMPRCRPSWRWLREREAIAAMALEFTILTAARRGEVLGATWEEIDFEAKIWTVPAPRTKAGREHRVPLSGRAMAIL